MKKLFSQLMFWIGLSLILFYVYAVHPPKFGRGYAEDMGYPEMTRQLMSEQIHLFGGPHFVTDKFMAPFGSSIPYMSWNLEHDWLGAYFWSWNPDFPFLWFYFLLSMLISYFGVGWCLRKMGFDRAWGWGIATAVVLFHIPRHFKIWHHYDHLLQHWLYLGLFLDALILHRLYRERRWSLQLEFWRGFLGIAMVGTAGYFWGPLLLEWVMVRAVMAGRAWRCAKRGERTAIDRISLRQAILPVLLSVAYLYIAYRWYYPLYLEVKKLGPVWQSLGWFAHFGYVFRPLWLDYFVNLPPIDKPETVVTVGWFYWVPAIFAMVLMARRKKFALIAPYFILLWIGIIYMSWEDSNLYFQRFIQATIPFMSYFRVACRWSLMFPEFLTLIVVLSWPELSEYWRARKPQTRFAAAMIFGAFSVFEVARLAYPVNAMPPLTPHAQAMLESVKAAPGDTVLDLPFCVAGGNGICTTEECPNYPSSVITGELRQWHDKKVYGIYQSRMTPELCQIYNRAPYVTWFDAWRRNRCFSPSEWDEFCGYLGQHSELSAILLYADVWSAAGTPQCLADFVLHLGRPLDEAALFTGPSRGGRGVRPTRVFRFEPRCVRNR